MAERLPLRRAGSPDVDAVQAVTKAAYEKWIAIIGREPRPMSADYDRAIANHIVDVWDEGGLVVALVEMIPRGDHLLIENIAVRPDRQGRGIGSRLLHHAEEISRSMGFNEVQLYTNEAFVSNLAFYSRRGYVEFRREAVVPGSVAVYMRKTV